MESDSEGLACVIAAIPPRAAASFLSLAARRPAAPAMSSPPSPVVLVTGGTGYIGSHTVLHLLSAGWDVVIVDSLVNSSARVLPRLRALADLPAASPRLSFVHADCRDESALSALFASQAARGRAVSAVVHFAGLKAVGESAAQPLLYYSANVVAAVALLSAMRGAGVRTLVFSSSCTVYGRSPSPLDEGAPAGGGITNAYARSKFHIEEMLRDLAAAEPGQWRIAVLRYFNPVGAHASGAIGEDPRGIPNCLMPYVLQVLVGRRPVLTVHGDDWPTRDGTPIRDYIHVDDVAAGHVKALDWLRGGDGGARAGVEAFNFGTGVGATVKELVAAMERAAGKPVPCVVGPRRAGDLVESYCKPDKALAVLGWRAERSLDDMCADAWRWQAANPAGYGDEAAEGGDEAAAGAAAAAESKA